MGCWDALVQGLQAKPPFPAHLSDPLDPFLSSLRYLGHRDSPTLEETSEPWLWNAVLQSRKHSTVPPAGCPGLPNPIVLPLGRPLLDGS